MRHIALISAFTVLCTPSSNRIHRIVKEKQYTLVNACCLLPPPTKQSLSSASAVTVHIADLLETTRLRWHKMGMIRIICVHSPRTLTRSWRSHQCVSALCRYAGRRAATCPDRDVGPVSADVLSRLLCWGTKGGRRRLRGPLERRSNPYYLSWVPPDWSARPPLNHLWNICSPTFSDIILFYFIFGCGIDEWYSHIGVNAWIRLWVLG